MLPFVETRNEPILNSIIEETIYPKEAVRLLRNVLGIIHGKKIIDLQNELKYPLPFNDHSVDVVLLGNACTSFDESIIISEIFRILKPKGGIGFIWNVLDDQIEWVKQLYNVRERIYGNKKNSNEFLEWKKLFEKLPSLFLPLQHRSVLFSSLGKVQQIFDHFSQTDLNEEFKQEVCTLLQIRHSERNEKDLLIPYRTETYWTFKP